LLDALSVLGDLPDELVTNQELRELTLPTLRADLQASEAHVFTAGPVLDVPIYAYLGRSDPLVDPEGLASAWAGHSTLAVHVRELDGGHFLTRDGQDLWLDAVLEDMRPLLARGEAHA
jgi:surfactin synthase thioesterase subunit